MNDNLSSSSGFFTENSLADLDKIVDCKKMHESSSGFNELWEFSRLGKLHVLKCLQPIYANDPLYKKLLRKEFDIAYKLEHVHICRTLGRENHPALGDCILMEYIDGETLESFMQKGKLTNDLAIKIINEICDALQYIHSKQIIHRDLKPTNILITYNGNNVKLIDFGLSDSDDYQILKIPAGTRRYIAPEQMQEGLQTDARADIYSLGVIIWKMGKMLHSRSFISVANKCRRHNREKRYSSANEVRNALYGKRKQKNYYIIPTIAAVSAAMVILFFLFNREPENHFPGLVPTATPSNNYVVSNHYQQILLAEKSKKDSLQLINQLTDALNLQFPISAQKQTVAYKKALENIYKEVETFMDKSSETTSP